MTPGSGPNHQSYVPAAGRDVLSRFYDPTIALTMREATFRGRLADQILADARGHADVVDVGGGTGTLAIELAQRGAQVTIVDADQQILRKARVKSGADVVRFRCAWASALPLENRSVDRVVMSLLLHHLTPEQKQAALHEARRVLRPDGRLHVADWGQPRGLVPRAGFLVLGLLDGREGTREHGAGQLPARIAGAGFADIATLTRLRTLWGTLELIRARPIPIA